ncbi:MAG TPA: SDR family NAD(P)-dependent oxidoreductase [Terriglobales bacterium]|nr:SDR family NAD(P)-dependent oxidoreductase [Terriglobales bacterium]
MSDTARIRRRADMTGRVAVLTGAGSDLGVALASYAAKRGMKVALADTDHRLLTAAHDKVRIRNVETLAVYMERFDLAALRELAQRTETELGPPWLVCNIAGPTVDGNLWGIINGVQVFAPGMALRGGGHIVNIASGDLFHLRGAAVDVAVSQAIVGLSESLYRELDSIQSSVGVTVVCPTLINTNLASTSRDNSSVPILLIIAAMVGAAVSEDGVVSSYARFIGPGQFDVARCDVVANERHLGCSGCRSRSLRHASHPLADILPSLIARVRRLENPVRGKETGEFVGAGSITCQMIGGESAPDFLARNEFVDCHEATQMCRMFERSW